MLLNISPDGNFDASIRDNVTLNDSDVRQLENLDNELQEVYTLLLRTGKLISLVHIAEILYTRKVIKNKSYDVQNKFWTGATYHPEVFTTTYFLNQAALGLRKWVPYVKKPKKKRKFYNIASQNIKNITIRVEKNIQTDVISYEHKLSEEELKESYLILSPQLLKLFKTVGEGFQLTVYCYGNYSFNAWVNIGTFTLHSPELKKYYLENKLKNGDIVYTEKRKDDPTGIHLFTTWQLNYPHLNSKMLEKKDVHIEIADGKNTTQNNVQSDNVDMYDPVYLLSLVQAKDLVYKYIKINGPSTVSNIIKAIANELAVKKELIEKLSVIDFSDERIIRLTDNKIALRELVEVTQINKKSNYKFLIVSLTILVILLLVLLFIVL